MRLTLQLAVIDAEVTDLIPGAVLERIATDGAWFEGPAWLPDGSLIWSDVVQNRLHRWTREDGTGVWLDPSHHHNGHTVDGRGRLLAACHGHRSVVRREDDGTWTTLADRWQGLRFNSPNDLVVASDGAVWFTDPRYGIDNPQEGYGGTAELDGQYVYRIDPGGAIARMSPAMPAPNGLAFSPDEAVLYVVDSEDHTILAYPVGDGWTLGEPRLFAAETGRFADGIRSDPAGRIWAACADGVRVYCRTGDLLGTLRTPELTTNLAFTPGWDRLAITSPSAVYLVEIDPVSLRS